MEVTPVKRTEELREHAPSDRAPRFRSGGDHAFPNRYQEAIHRPDVRVWAVGTLTVVEFLKAHALIENEAARELSERIQRLVADGHVRVVFDLTTVPSVSKGVIGLLARLYRDVNEAGGLLRLYGLEPLLLDAVQICRLDRVVEICTDLATALDLPPDRLSPDDFQRGAGHNANE
jgi:anti-anti-sigma factor